MRPTDRTVGPAGPCRCVTRPAAVVSPSTQVIPSEVAKMAKQPRDARRSGPVKGMGINEQVIFLNSVLESFTGHAIVAMDLHGTILKWNEGARRTYGYEA